MLNAGDRLFEPARLRRIALMRLPVSVAVLVGYLCYQSRVGLTDGRGVPFGSDSIIFWSAARLALAGHPAMAYDSLAIQPFETAIAGASVRFVTFPYPPVAMLLLLPLAGIPFPAGYVVWTLGGPSAHALAVWQSWHSRQAMLLALAAPAMLVNTCTGQTGAWMAALLGGGLSLLSRLPAVAGVLLGLLTFKPHLALLVPLALLFGREWRALATFAATAMLLVLVTGLLWGPQLWITWIHYSAVLRPFLFEDAPEFWRRIPSAFVMLRVFQFPLTICYAGQAIVSIAVCAINAGMWWSKASPMDRSGIRLPPARTAFGTRGIGVAAVDPAVS